MTGVGLAGDLYSQALTNNNHFTAAYATLIGGSVLSLAGCAFSLVGLIQSVHYADWQAKHPALAGISPSGYRLVF